MTGAQLLFWTDYLADGTPGEPVLPGDRRWLCLRESYFDFLLANGESPFEAMKRLMEDARTVNGPL